MIMPCNTTESQNCFSELNLIIIFFFLGGGGGGGGGGGLDGWMTCDLMSFSTDFSHIMTIMKGCMQWNPIYSEEDFA